MKMMFFSFPSDRVATNLKTLFYNIRVVATETGERINTAEEVARSAVASVDIRNSLSEILQNSGKTLDNSKKKLVRLKEFFDAELISGKAYSEAKKKILRDF
jgi:uncharacterized protein related to proFAR isomerase